MPAVPGFDPVVTVLDTTRNIMFINKDVFDSLDEEGQRALIKVRANTPLVT